MTAHPLPRPRSRHLAAALLGLAVLLITPACKGGDDPAPTATTPPGSTSNSALVWGAGNWGEQQFAETP